MKGDAEARMAAWLRPALRERSAYPVADGRGLLKLDAMENPYDWPGPALREAWHAAIADVRLNRYPDTEARELKQALLAYFELPGDTPLLLGNGSDELLLLLMVAFGGHDRVVLGAEPAFVLYRHLAELNGHRYVGVPLRPDDFSLDVPAMLAAIERHQPALVFLASPNNPTGNLYEPAAVQAIIDAAPGVVVLDEAYVPFAGTSSVDLVHRHAHVFVMQTVSKLGLAGLRIGMLFAGPEWLHELGKARLPYNMDALCQATGVFLLGQRARLHAEVRAIVAERERLRLRLAAVPGVLRVWPSAANFLAFRVAVDAREVHARLRAAGVLIKCLHGQHPLLDGCLRVTATTEAEGERFLAALAPLLG